MTQQGHIQWAEKEHKPVGRFEQLAQTVDRRANPGDGFEPKWGDPAEQYGLVDNFVDGVLAAADREELQPSGGGDAYTRAELQQSFDALSLALNSANDETKAQRVHDALAGFPRAEGVRSGIKTLVQGENTSGVFADYLTDSIAARKMERGEQARPADQLRKVGDSTAHAAGLENPGMITGIPDEIMQPKQTIAEMMGDSPRTEQEPMSIDEQIDKLTEGMSEDQVDALYRYARHKAAKRDSQRAGDGHGSMISGQYMGEAYKAMSPDTKTIADRMASLYDRKWTNL